ncbi:MAG TPA: hypothetical protein VNL15_08740 [Dehalococcoidia bacterium]|nr:hypothetical protein [Dehalococcoidia bacterium]
MVWLWTKASHEASIKPLVRAWLRGSMLDRLLLISGPGIIWALVWGVLAYAADAAVLFGIIGLAPWYFWLVDAVVDHYHTNGEIGRMMTAENTVLATRAEYVGGHPELPHGRFGYLAIQGYRENPMLRVVFPGQQGTDGTAFDIPLLDIAKTKPERERDGASAAALLASLNEKIGGIFGLERITLNVDYEGSGGRKHRVELKSFYRGNDEIRNWRNYLVCAQAEAATGKKPFGPWKSLQASPPEVASDGSSGDGSKLQPARRAFERR